MSRKAAVPADFSNPLTALVKSRGGERQQPIHYNDLFSMGFKMKIALDKKGTLAGFEEALDAVMQTDEPKGLLVLSCADNHLLPEQLDPVLAQIDQPLFGGCFPCIVHGNEVYERGTAVVALPVAPTVQMIENLSQDRESFDDEIDSALFEHVNDGTMFVIVDGLSLCVNALLESIFNEIGLLTGYIGGGAASLALKPQPCLLTNAGIKQDCAILAHLPLNSGIGIAHGMKSVQGPYKVTSTSFNMITSIDWQPAAPFYTDIVENHPDCCSRRESFIGTDAHYSLGLNRYDSERVVIEPIKVGSDNSLGFMMAVREGEFVDVMHITEDTMIQSAATAAKLAFASKMDSAPARTIITFDCVSRKLFLGSRFCEELEAICTAGVAHVGALTCGGEIGTSGSDFLDYHNRTCVVSVFEE